MTRDPRVVPTWAGIGLLVVTVAFVLAGLSLGLLAHTSEDLAFAVSAALATIAYSASGAILVSRLPRNPIGWIVIAAGTFQAVLLFAGGYAMFATWGVEDHRRFGELAAWTGGWIWILSIAPLVTFLLLLFPDGHPPSPRWRWVGWTAAVGIVLAAVGTAVALFGHRFALLRDPSADISPEGVWGSIAGAGLFLSYGVAGLASVASLATRWRRSRADERQQLRWFLLGASVLVIGVLLAFTIDQRYIVLEIGFLMLPITTAVSVTKYHLYDLDLVIKKTLVFAILVTLLMAVGAAIAVILTGLLVGTLSDVPPLFLLTGLAIGLLSTPLYRVAKRIADRFVYGGRATPYEVLTSLSGSLAETYAADDVLPRMAQILANGTGASTARVLLKVGRTEREAARWPTGAALDGEEHRTPVIHRGDELGALTVTMPPNDPYDTARARLVADLAAQAGLVLRNARLIEELRASRQRLVAAQDEERRKIERNLHDGIQQQLVAMNVQLGLLGRAAERDPSSVGTMTAVLQTRATEALEDLRDLARGIYPPLLADRGLPVALEAQARKAAVPVQVRAPDLGRYPQEVEAAAYFCVLEALNNVAKYANASGVRVELTDGDGELRFVVADDGVGFDPTVGASGTGLQGMADRVAAIGGDLEVRSAPGQGTTVLGRIPLEAS